MLRALSQAHVYYEPYGVRSWLPAAPGLGLTLAPTVEAPDGEAMRRLRVPATAGRGTDQKK